MTPLAATDLARALRTVVCGVDGTAAGHEAARQAAALTGPLGRLELVTVNADRGTHRTSALAAEQRAATARGVDASTRSLAAATAADGLIRAAARADLLVIGCDSVGRVPKAVLRRASCSVLLSRRQPDLPLLDAIIVASDAPPGVRATAARIASEHGSALRQARREIVATVAAATGSGLIVIGDDGHAIDVARIAPCSVLVVRRSNRPA